MEDMGFKLYAVNLGALLFSSMENINSMLQTVVLLLTIGYTGLLIYYKYKNKS